MVERRHVAILAFPCEMYQDAGAELARVELVALVREAKGESIPPAWDGAWAICPLPNLMGDGRMWLVDFRALANVDRDYLDFGKRACCLSEAGWAFFRQRLALCHARAAAMLEEHVEAGKPTWHEVTCWQRWIASGRERAAFHDWLNSPDPSLSGMTKRVALERGMYAQVQALLDV